MVPAPAPDTPEAVDAVLATAAAAAEPLAALADEETALGLPRLTGELAHPAHPRLSARLAEIAGEAMAGAGVTTGPFGIVHGFDAGTRLVSHPAVRAVGSPDRWLAASRCGGWPPRAPR